MCRQQIMAACISLPPLASRDFTKKCLQASKEFLHEMHQSFQSHAILQHLDTPRGSSQEIQLAVLAAILKSCKHQQTNPHFLCAHPSALKFLCFSLQILKHFLRSGGRAGDDADAAGLKAQLCAVQSTNPYRARTETELCFPHPATI